MILIPAIRWKVFHSDKRSWPMNEASSFWPDVTVCNDCYLGIDVRVGACAIRFVVVFYKFINDGRKVKGSSTTIYCCRAKWPRYTLLNWGLDVQIPGSNIKWANGFECRKGNLSLIKPYWSNYNKHFLYLQHTIELDCLSDNATR